MVTQVCIQKFVKGGTEKKNVAPEQSHPSSQSSI